MRFILRLLITAIAVLIAAKVVPGIQVDSFWVALVVALILGILNATLGQFLKIVTFPLSLVTLGFFLLVINALVFWLASFVKGFSVAGFWPAFFGSLIVTIIAMIGRRVIK
jgi:putative membrane protein